MQPQYFFCCIFLNRLAAGRRVGTVIYRLQELANLKKFPKPSGRMSDFFERSCKSISNIQKTAEDLKMKLLRSGVPNELFNQELNSIVHQCKILIDDTENETLKIPKNTTAQENLNLNLMDNFFDEDPFDYTDINSTTTSKIRLGIPPPDTYLDRKIIKLVNKDTKKRKSTCLSEPVSTATENVHRSKDYTQDESGWVTAFIDGSCLNNGRGGARAGLGVWFSANSTLNLSEPVKGRLTNNVGEIEAATRAVEQAHSVGISKLILKTDSMFLINCIMKWRLTWEKNGWKTSANKPVINQLEIQNLTKTLDETKVAVRWEHVKAHSNIEGNEAADVLAKQGAEKCGLRTFLK